MNFEAFGNDFESHMRMYEAEIQPYKSISSVEEVERHFDRKLGNFIAEVLDITDPYDPFDLIELMRLYELNPVAPSPRSSALSIELLAAVLISRQGRHCEAELKRGVPGQVIEHIHALCGSLTAHLIWTELLKEKLYPLPAAEGSAIYQTSRTVIRNYQFDRIRDDHDALLLDNEISKSLMHEHFGYGLADVKAIRDAIDEIQADRLTRLRDESSSKIMEVLKRGEGFQGATDEEKELFKKDITALLINPASRAVMSIDDIAAESALSSALVEKMIADFSLDFGRSTAEKNVRGLLNGNWLFNYKPLIRDENGEFVIVANGVGNDVFRRIFEEKLKRNPKDHQKYDQKVRAPVTEELAATYIKKILKSGDFFTGLHYAWATKRSDSIKLDASFRFDRAMCELAESDGLFIKDNVALIVEVKGKSISDKAREGHRVKFARDVKDTVKNAQKQALRLADLILENSGVWLGTGKWLDLGNVTRVFSVIVLLDDVGPVSVQASGNATGFGGKTWVVTLHDLAVISEVLKQPHDFLSYVQCRAMQSQGYEIVSVDELDVFTQFLSGELFSNIEKSSLFRRVPIYAPSGGLLDEWMNREELSSYLEKPLRPILRIGRIAKRWISEVRAQESAGYVSVCMDLSLFALKNCEAFEAQLAEIEEWECEEGSYDRFLLDDKSGEIAIQIFKFGKRVKFFDLLILARHSQSRENRNYLNLFVDKENRIKGFSRS